MVFLGKLEKKENIDLEKSIKKFFLGLGLRINLYYLNSDLPRSANGKISYGKLREYLQEILINK